MNRTPLILAIVLLLLPVLYVGSYFALVVPTGHDQWMIDGDYRWQPTACSKLFWPLEQIDRKMRPKAWQPFDPFQ